ncbi:hypothetical protein KSS87_023818 [Heliosperma pusillum]|nr:hypothetical protein KSS87_023818 [Heliosperma pusillum]
MDSHNNIKTMDNENEKKLIKYNGWKAMPCVIGNETFEKLGTIGTSSNLLVYLTTVFNMKSMEATNVLNIFNGSANFGTLLGAFLWENCIRPTTGQLAFLLGGLVFLIIGAGGIRPCNLAFGADQFDPETESGKRGISSFFNWYYFTLTFAVMVSVTFVVYIQSNISWAIGLAIPALFMFLSCALFFMGTKLYVMIKPQGSPLVSVAQVIAAAFKKRRLELPEKPALSLFDYVPDNKQSIVIPKLPYSNQFRFLEKAAIVTEEDGINPDGSPTDPWKLCSIQQVEQLKCLIRVFPIWISGILYSVSTATMNNYTVFQALQADRRLGPTFKIPAASYAIFTMITITFWIPFYDRILVPKLRKLTGKEDGITVLQKLGVGIVILIFSLATCGFFEHSRREFSETRPTLGVDPQRGAISSLSAMWLVFPLALSGLSEAFTMIALVEFYYKQFPENMRSIGAAFVFCGMAMSNYLSSFLQSAVNQMSHGSKNGTWLTQDLNKGRLDYFYYLMAGIEVFNLVYFLVCSNWYRYRGTSDSSSDEKLEEIKSEIALV